MFEKGIRGGITQTVKRYAKANNMYMKDQHNPDENSTCLQYLDANNLYGWVIIKKTINTWVSMGESRLFYP